jgi:tetratricopeptide (TPR) repeat protein
MAAVWVPVALVVSLGLLLTTGALALLCRPRTERAVGREVMLKGPGVRFGDLEPNGTFAPRGLLNVPLVTITGCRGRWLGFRQDNVEGWLLRDAAVPVEEAVGYWGEVLRTDPGHVAARVWRGLAGDAVGRSDEALADYTAVLHLDPNVWRAFFDRADQDWFRGKDDDRGLADWDEVIRRHPAWAGGHVGRGILWCSVGNLDRAFTDFSAGARTDPADGLPYLSLAEVHYARQEYDHTIRTCTEAVRLNPGLRLAYSFRGMAHHAQGRYDEALRDYDEAIGRGSVRPADFVNRGKAWYAKGALDRAEADFNGALRFDPGRTEAYFLRGLCRALRKEYGSALDDLSIAAHRAPSSPWALFWRARVHEQRRDYAQAAQDVAEALERGPDEPWLLNLAAWLWATCPEPKLRDGRKAVHYATRACERSEGTVWWIIDTLAAAYAEAGDFTRALQYQRQVLEAADLPENHRDVARRALDLYQRGEPYRDHEPAPLVPVPNPGNPA